MAYRDPFKAAMERIRKDYHLAPGDAFRERVYDSIAGLGHRPHRKGSVHPLEVPRRLQRLEEGITGD